MRRDVEDWCFHMYREQAPHTSAPRRAGKPLYIRSEEKRACVGAAGKTYVHAAEKPLYVRVAENPLYMYVRVAEKPPYLRAASRAHHRARAAPRPHKVITASPPDTSACKSN